MKLLQWNIWYQEDIKNILKTIEGINPDIICLQELSINHPEFNRGIDTAKYLAEHLKFHYFFKEAHDHPKNTFGNGIFSRFPIIESKSIFTKNPDRSASDDHFSVQGRAYLECAIDAVGKRLSVATTHVSYTHKFESTPAKEVETKNLVNILRGKKDRFIFTGDLNSLPGSPTIDAIQQHLKNAGPPLEQNTWTTKPFSYKGFNADGLKWRLDYCFTTPDIHVRSAQIIATPYSDHLPVLIEF